MFHAVSLVNVRMFNSSKDSIFFFNFLKKLHNSSFLISHLFDDLEFISEWLYWTLLIQFLTQLFSHGACISMANPLIPPKFCRDLTQWIHALLSFLFNLFLTIDSSNYIIFRASTKWTWKFLFRRGSVTKAKIQSFIPSSSLELPWFFLFNVVSSKEKYK